MRGPETQGVLIPSANVQHLMLREDVVRACAEGRFAVYPVASVDEGIALLTGLEAGERQADGAFPARSVNRRVEDRLRAFADIRRNFGSASASSWRWAPGRRCRMRSTANRPKHRLRFRSRPGIDSTSDDADYCCSGEGPP